MLGNNRGGVSNPTVNLLSQFNPICCTAGFPRGTLECVVTLYLVLTMP